MLAYEATGSDERLPDDAAVTLDYVRAQDHELAAVRRTGGPQNLTQALIRQLHCVLMSGADYRRPKDPANGGRCKTGSGGAAFRPPVTDRIVLTTELGGPSRDSHSADVSLPQQHLQACAEKAAASGLTIVSVARERDGYRAPGRRR